MRSLILAGGLTVGLLVAPVGADVFHCVGEHGEPLFSQVPCGNRTQAIRLPAGHDDEPARGLRDSERRWLEARRQARSRNKARPARRAGASADKVARQRYQCQRKAQALDAVKAQLRRGYKPAQGEKLRRRRSSYEDYLDAFCG